MYLLAGAGAAAAALLALLLLLLLARRKKKAAEAAALAEAEAAAAEQLIEYDEEGMPIAPSAEAEIGPITPMKDKRREEIQQFAKSNPEITAQMIKSLLKAEAEG
jgi:flagellar biosynthesis/type III secretory pathway M-ring protein FliF/YscJ